jgi:NAD(P)-dependent dehydrogenase (short-subunit alcohol dehydrogenase family)
MIMCGLSDKTTVVVGASRGLGRGIAGAFADAGSALLDLIEADPATTAPAYVLTGAGLTKTP